MLVNEVNICSNCSSSIVFDGIVVMNNLHVASENRILDKKRKIDTEIHTDNAVPPSIVPLLVASEEPFNNLLKMTELSIVRRDCQW